MGTKLQHCRRDGQVLTYARWTITDEDTYHDDDEVDVYEERFHWGEEEEDESELWLMLAVAVPAGAALWTFVLWLVNR